MSRTWKREPIRRNRFDELELSQYNKNKKRERKEARKSVRSTDMMEQAHA